MIRQALVSCSLVLALAGCSKQPPHNNQDMTIDDNLSAGQPPPNAEIETLPADESSTTPSNQLQSGFDNPDVNSFGNGH